MTRKKWSWKRLRRLNATSVLLLGFAAYGGGVSRLFAGTPDWLRAVARAPLPNYPEDKNAVMLLNEQVTTVNDNGEIRTAFRRAYKILRPQGRQVGTVEVYFDSETRLTFLKGWSIPAQGDEYEVKEKDAIETSPFGDVLYQDTRLKILKIPAAEPGNVVGYEYEQKRRPYVLQDFWWFQEEVPVRMARFVLRLPKGWEYETSWLNHTAREPRNIGENQWMWELENISAVETEPAMPPWQAVAGRLAVTYYPRGGKIQGRSHGSWRDVGLWYAQLASARRQLTPEIRQKVQELTAAAPGVLDKIKALAAFLQRDIRYVAIEIGIGGYQPHAAQEVFINRYGDCKDKATLLSAMLGEIGIESYYVLVNTKRGAVAQGFPSARNFNHAILAIRLPENVPTPNLYSLRKHDRLGNLLFFDPTDPWTPLGYLPPTEQANFGLLVAEDGGELLQLPLQPPSTNRLLRGGKLTLSPTGTLVGEVEEIRWGSPATSRRAQFLEVQASERAKVLESFLGSFLGGFRLTRASVDNLERFDQVLILYYGFVAENYAQRAGDLLLVRPRVLGQKSSSLLEKKERKYPVEFPDASLETDIFEIAIPTGYQVDELPPPAQAESSFGEYRSKILVEGNVLHYTRTYQIKGVWIPTERLDELKKFFRQVAADERSNVVLKRVEP